MMFRAGLATLLAGASAASAISISTQCSNALQSLALGPAAQCINANGIVNIGLSGTNNSIVTPFNAWLNGFCAATPCSNTTIQGFVTNLTSACSSDIAQFGISLPSDSELTSLVEQYYPTVIDAACLKLSTNNTFCATQLLTNLQSAVGTLSASNLISKIPTIVAGLGSVPTSVTCNDCTKEMYNVIAHQQPQLNSTIQGGFSGECGASFTDGTSPTDIFEATGTVTATSTSKSAGFVLPVSRSVVVGLAVSGLTAVFSGFFVLA